MDNMFKGLDLEPRNHMQHFKTLSILNGKTVMFSVYRKKAEDGNTKETKIRVTPESGIYKPSHFEMRDDFIQYKQGEGFKASDLTHYLTKVHAGYVGHQPLNEKAQKDCISLAETLKQQIEWLESGHHAKITNALNELCTIDIVRVRQEIAAAACKSRKTIKANWNHHTQLNRTGSYEYADLVDENQNVIEAYSNVLNSIISKLPTMTEQDVKALRAYQNIRAMQAQGHPDYIDLMNPSWEGGEYPEEMRNDAISDVINRIKPISKVAEERAVMNLNESLPIRVNATMQTELEYTGVITLQDLIESGHLSPSEADDQSCIYDALNRYAKELDGGEFVEREGLSGNWTIDSAQFVENSERLKK